MKSVCFTVELKNGQQSCVGVSDKVGTLVDQAKKARVAGAVKINGKEQAIVGGVVFHTSGFGPIYSFKYRPVAAKPVAKPVVKDESKEVEPDEDESKEK